MRQDELAERPTDGLAQSHPRPPPLHPPAQGALHVRDRVAFQDGEGSDSCARSVHGVEAPDSPRLRPRRLSHLPELFSFHLAGHGGVGPRVEAQDVRSEEHTSELQSHSDLVCRLLLEKKKKTKNTIHIEKTTQTNITHYRN